MVIHYETPRVSSHKKQKASHIVVGSLLAVAWLSAEAYNSLCQEKLDVMPKVGIEPTLPKEHEFESCASASSATSAEST